MNEGLKTTLFISSIVLGYILISNIRGQAEEDIGGQAGLSNVRIVE